MNERIAFPLFDNAGADLPKKARHLVVEPCAVEHARNLIASWHSRLPTTISYQDKAVHLGTIYRAAGWTPAYESAPRVRDRSKPRPSGRDYRWNINGVEPDGAGKVRWELAL